MDLLEKLIATPGVSGNEDKVRELIKKEIEKYVDDVSVDKVGNLIAHKKGKHPRIMLASHMDEVGLMIKGVSSTGRILISVIGGVDPVMLLGERVHIETKRGIIHGVITTKDVNDGEIVSKIPRTEDIFVDTGLTKKQLEKIGVEIGAFLTFERDLYFLGSNRIICGKAFDDRIGCYIMIELAKRLRKIKNEMFYVFTIQEEIGLVGAITSTYKVKPDWAIAVDTAETCETTDEVTKTIGGGPCITIKDAETIGNKTINKWLIDIAKKNKIQIQRDVTDVGMTDAATISITGEGVPCTVVCVPIRNLHTATSVAHKDDIDNAIKLLEKLFKSAPDGKLF
ncbi:MAG: M42 family peptidase [Candidatus Aenigmatarchaeota archaeon]